MFLLNLIQDNQKPILDCAEPNLKALAQKLIQDKYNVNQQRIQ